MVEQDIENSTPLRQVLTFVVKTLALVFLLAIAWEFAFETYMIMYIDPNAEVESEHERWEYVITIMIFTTFALIVTGRALYVDIKKRNKLEKTLNHLASHDPLTGLPNRTLLFDRIKQAMRRAHRTRAKAAILFIDLRGFKGLNDRLGHENGDLALKKVADRLRMCMRETDTASRYGGDEFVVVMTDLGDPKDVYPMMEKIKRSLSEPFLLGGESVSIRASVGAALYPDNGEEAEDLLSAADQAMYDARANEATLHRPGTA